MTVYDKAQAQTMFRIIENNISDLAGKVTGLSAITDDERSIADMMWSLGEVNGILYRIRYEWEQKQTDNPEWEPQHGR